MWIPFNTFIQINSNEYMQYEESLKYYRDLKNSLDTAREEGLKEGLKEGEQRKQIEIARKLKQMGMSSDEIQEITGLSREDIERL
jgi:predicted transposase/invertase (TIGR01784 family)